MLLRTALVIVLVALVLAAASRARAAAPSSWMTTPTPRPGDWMKRHEGFVELAHHSAEVGGGIDVLFIGDSITDGWRNTGHASWKKHFEPLKPANFGIGGDGTHNVLWRLTHGELEVVKPRVVVLLIGTNNIPWAVENAPMNDAVAMVSEAVQLVVSTIREKLPETRILLLAIFPRGEHPNPSREAIKQVNAKLATLESDHVHYLDLGHLFLEGDHIPPALMPDFLHPSALAYERWAPAMLPAIQSLMSAQQEKR